MPQAGKAEKYAIQMNEIGKTDRLRSSVGNESGGQGHEVVWPRENRGLEVKEKRFLNQFRGKTPAQLHPCGRGHHQLHGRHVEFESRNARVKRALLLFDAFILGKLATNGARKPVRAAVAMSSSPNGCGFSEGAA